MPRTFFCLLCVLVLQVNGRSVILCHYAFFFFLEENKTQNLSLSASIPQAN